MWLGSSQRDVPCSPPTGKKCYLILRLQQPKSSRLRGGAEAVENRLAKGHILPTALLHAQEPTSGIVRDAYYSAR